MGWRHDEKKARKLADSDPAAALALMETVVAAAADSPLCEDERVCDLLAFQSEVAEKAGRSDAAASARTELEQRCETGIAEQDRLLEEGGGPMTISGALQKKVRYLDSLGRTSEADRVRLQAADFCLAAVGDAGARAGLAATPFFVAAQGAMGLEAGRAFQRGYESNFRAVAEVMRDPVLKDGRALALAYCKRCGGVVEANWKKGRCVKKHKVDEVRVVLAEEANAVRAELQ